jgi:hypothetical protein
VRVADTKDQIFKALVCNDIKLPCLHACIHACVAVVPPLHIHKP